MSEPLTPTEEEMQWWEEAQDAAEEAEALVEWLGEFITEFDPILRATRFQGKVVQDVAHLVQVRDSLVHAWGLNPAFTGLPAF